MRRAHELSKLNWNPFILMFHYQNIHFGSVKGEKAPRTSNEQQQQQNVIFYFQSLSWLSHCRNEMSKHYRPLAPRFLYTFNVLFSSFSLVINKLKIQTASSLNLWFWWKWRRWGYEKKKKMARIGSNMILNEQVLLWRNSIGNYETTTTKKLLWIACGSWK